MEKEAWWAWFDEQLKSLPLWSDVVQKRMIVEETLPPIKKEVDDVPS
jgi:hypothetical protein